MSPRPGRPRRPSDLDLVRLAGLLRHQQGVVARRQVIELGGTDVDVRRRLRRREWVAVHPGVYLDHTGPPTWEQRAWAAVLACWPAALTGDSALRAHGFRADRPLTAIEDAMHVMVAAGQSPGPFAGVRIERVRDPGRWLAKQSAVPRAGVEYAALKAAAKRTEAAAVALLGEVCQSRLTTPARIAETLDELPRLPRRRLLLAILRDVADGTYSVLERRYLRDVEWAHGLPAGSRQVKAVTGTRIAYRDVSYPDLRTLVELDGRLGHEKPMDRWADLDRDLAAVATDQVTLRLGWGQVLEPCRLAVSLGPLLQRRGWSGAARPCSPGCPVPDRAAQPSPGDRGTTPSEVDPT